MRIVPLELVALAVPLVLALAPARGAVAAPDVRPAERRALDQCLAAMPSGVQIAVALVTADGVRFLGGEHGPDGVRPIENNDAVFQIGSITKVFTATLFAQEVVSGRLRLDEPVAGRLPFRLRASGRDGAEITLVELASHTSGIAHHLPPGANRHALFHFHPDEPLRDFEEARFRAYLTDDLELFARPGTAYRYSNLGMSLLGLVVTLETGMPYEKLLQQRIFAPLGMTRSTTEIERVRPHLVGGRKPNGKPFPNQFFAALTPCGGIYSTAADLARFLAVEIEHADPAIALTQRPVFTIAEGEQVALGWHVYDWTAGWRTLNHNGGIGGYTSSVYVDTAHRLGVVVLSNVMNEDPQGEAVRALARALLKQLEAPGP